MRRNLESQRRALLHLALKIFKIETIEKSWGHKRKQQILKNANKRMRTKNTRKKNNQKRRNQNRRKQVLRVMVKILVISHLEKLIELGHIISEILRALL